MRFIYTKTFSIAFGLFLSISVLFILDRAGYLSFFKDNLAKAYGGTVNIAGKATNGVKNLFITLGTIKNLSRDNAVLNHKIDELSFENARLTSAKQENSALRKALGFLEQSEFNLLPVQAVLADASGFTKTIVVDKGANSGVELNDAVVATPGLLVGKVSKVLSNTSEVTLITDPTILINAEIVDSGARGLVKGDHGLSLSFDLLTQNELVKAQDKVITSGLSADFPRGLYIGEIAGIRSQASELFQKAYVIPAADLRNLKFLFVVK